MTTIADLVRSLNDIDRHFGRVCGACRHYKLMGGPGMVNQPRQCLKGHGPADENDGCGEFSKRPDKKGQRQAI